MISDERFLSSSRASGAVAGMNFQCQPRRFCGPSSDTIEIVFSHHVQELIGDTRARVRVELGTVICSQHDSEIFIAEKVSLAVFMNSLLIRRRRRATSLLTKPASQAIPQFELAHLWRYVLHL